jgi:Zn-dependent metalloprotease
MDLHNHNPIFCAIPPHILKQIQEKGSKKQKDKINKIINLSGQIRGKRQSLADLASKPATSVGNKHRLVYDAQNDQNLPGTLARSEGDPPTNDDSVNEAYDGAGATYDLYNDIFGRNSIDNNGMHLISTVHFMQGYDNAFWDGEQMVYGDGDEDLPEAERLFKRFTSAIDIIGHELTHGVTQFEANLTYFGQSGALNESFSDVFGTLVKQRINNQKAEEADWLIGAELFTENVAGDAIRSMKAPGTAYNDPVIGKDPQPGHMDNYVITPRDNGGVHINSGIPNRAFYITATEMGGYAWEKAGRIWYKTLCDELTGSSKFQEAADLTYKTAKDLYGNRSDEAKAVYKGWETVGIIPETSRFRGCNWFFNLFRRRN